MGARTRLRNANPDDDEGTSVSSCLRTRIIRGHVHAASPWQKTLRNSLAKGSLTSNVPSPQSPARPPRPDRPVLWCNQMLERRIGPGHNYKEATIPPSISLSIHAAACAPSPSLSLPLSLSTHVIHPPLAWIRARALVAIVVANSSATTALISSAGPDKRFRPHLHLPLYLLTADLRSTFLAFPLVPVPSTT